MSSGSDYPEERPAHPHQIDEFWIDRTPVVNAQLAEFGDANGYLPLPP